MSYHRACRPARIVDPNADVDAAELAKTCLRAIREFLYDLDAPDVARKFGQNGRLVSQSGADLENCLVPFGGKEVRHKRTHERLGNGLFEPDRERRILIRKLGKG